MSFLDDSDDESTVSFGGGGMIGGNPLASSTGARLGSLFGGGDSDSTDSDFKFKPSPTSSNGSSQMQRKLSSASISSTSTTNSSVTPSVSTANVQNKVRGENGTVIHALVVELFLFSNEARQYQPFGKVGAAILNNHPIPNLIFYRNPSDIVLQVPITAQHTLLTLQLGATSNFASLHDLHSNRILSIGFQNADAATHFAKMICVAKFMGQQTMDITTVNLNELGNNSGPVDQSVAACRDGLKIYVKYSGWIVDNDPKKGLSLGKLFDTNENSNNLFGFKFGESEVISGWEQALKNVRQGGKKFCVIPSHLAYGERGAANVIPPNSILCFQIEVVKIKKIKSASSTTASMPTIVTSPQQQPIVQTVSSPVNLTQQQQQPVEADLKVRMARIGAQSYGVVLPQQQQPEVVQQQVQQPVATPVVQEQQPVSTPVINTTTSNSTATTPATTSIPVENTAETSTSGSNSEIEALKQQLASLQSLISQTQQQPTNVPATTTVSTPTTATPTIVEKPVEKPAIVEKAVEKKAPSNQWIDDVSVLLSRLDKIERNIDNLSFTQLIRNTSKFGNDLDEEEDKDHDGDEEENSAEKDIIVNGYQLKKFKKSHIYMSGPLLIENIQHLLATNSKLQTDLQKEREQVDSLIEKISQLRKKQEKYAQQQLELTHLSLESSNLSEKGMYEEELQKLNETIASLRKQLAEQKRKTSRAQEQVQSEKENIENLQSEIEVLKREIEEINNENKKKRSKSDADHKEKIASVEEEWQEKLQKLENEHNFALQKLKREQKQEIERIKTEASQDLERNLKSSETGAEALRESIEKLWKEKIKNIEEQATEEIEGLKQSVANLSASNSSHTSQIARLTQELEAKTEEVSDLESTNISNLQKMREKFLEALNTKSDNVRTLFKTVFRNLINKVYRTFSTGINGKKLSHAKLSSFLGQIVKKFSLKVMSLITEEFSGLDLLNFDPNLYIDFDEDEEEEVDEDVSRRRSLILLDLEEDEVEDLELEEEDEEEEEETKEQVSKEALEAVIRQELENEWNVKLEDLKSEFNDSLKEEIAKYESQIESLQEQVTLAKSQAPVIIQQVAEPVTEQSAPEVTPVAEVANVLEEEPVTVVEQEETKEEPIVVEQPQEEPVTTISESVAEEQEEPVTTAEPVPETTEEPQNEIVATTEPESIVEEQEISEEEPVVETTPEVVQQEEEPTTQEEPAVTETTTEPETSETVEEPSVAQEEPIAVTESTEPAVVEEQQAEEETTTEPAAVVEVTEPVIEQSTPEVSGEQDPVEEAPETVEEPAQVPETKEEADDLEYVDSTQSSQEEDKPTNGSAKKLPSVFDETTDASQIDPWLQSTATSSVVETKPKASFLFEDDLEDEAALKKKQEELQKKKKATTSKLFEDLDDDFL